MPNAFTGKDADLLTEINSRFDYCLEQWGDIRKEAAIDMRFVAGDSWNPQDRQDRVEAGRPCAAFDETNQYFNQVLNDFRANPRAVKFTANGNGANDKTAEFYADHMRETEYRSRGSQVYITALENALYRGYGFFRLKTKYISPRTRNQDIWLEAFPNPDMVLPDPDCLSPTSDDMKFCFAFETWKIDEFKRKYPKAKITDFNSYITISPKFVTANTVVVAEYWTFKNAEKELVGLRLPDGREIEGFTDELVKQIGQPAIDAAHELYREKRDMPSVCQYLTNGVEILSTTEWPGKYIPIVSVYGKILWVNDDGTAKRTILSMTRAMRDPQMAYNFYRTSELENVGLTTKNPYWAYRGQLNSEELLAISKSIHEPVAILTAGALSEATGQQVLPLPQRTMMEGQIHALSVGAEEMRRAIQAAAATSFLPTVAQRQNDKSGVALDSIDRQAQKGSFHFVDHALEGIQRGGVIYEDLLPHTIDTARDVTARKADNTAYSVRVNDPAGLPSLQGDHLVTVSTGPSYDSERDKVNQFSENLLKEPVVLQIVGPEKAQKLLGQTIRLMDIGAKGDQIADIIDPPMGKDGQPTLPMAMQKIQEMQHAGQQMQQALEGAKQIIETKQVETQGRKEIELEKIASNERIAMAEIESKAADREVKLTVAALEGKFETIQNAMTLFMDERTRLGLQAGEHRHELGMAGVDHAHELVQAQHAADIAPPPSSPPEQSPPA